MRFQCHTIQSVAFGYNALNDSQWMQRLPTIVEIFDSSFAMNSSFCHTSSQV